MANIKSQIKRNKQNEKARQRNKAVKSSLKTSVRKFREAADAGDAGEATLAMRAAVQQPGQGGQQGRDPQEPGREPQVRHRQARRGAAGLTSPLVPVGRCLSPLATCGDEGQRGQRDAPAGHDLADGHLKRVAGARALPLDLGVRLRHGGQRPRHPLRRPAAQLLPHLVDLPRRGADLGGQGRTGPAARGAAHPAEQPDSLGEPAGDQHRGHADGQRPAQQFQRLAEPPLDRPVGHREAARLGPAPVVPGHHGLVDHPGGVGGELPARRGDLPQVRPERVEQRPHAAVLDGPARLAELTPHEHHPVGQPGDLRAIDDRCALLRQGGQQRLAFRPAGMGQHQHHVRRRGGRGAGQFVGDVLGGILHVTDHHDGAVAEQRRRGQRGQLAGPERRRAHVMHVIGHPGLSPARDAPGAGHEARDRPLDEQFLVAHHDRDRGVAGRGESGRTARGAWRHTGQHMTGGRQAAPALPPRGGRHG